MTTNRFGELLHAWRDRLAPADAGITATTRRRAPGLRREELAMLAGLSVDYVIRLEHGRATRPSAQVVTSLARALQLDRAERDLLFTTAGLLPPQDGTINTLIPASVQRLVNRLTDVPIGVFAADWTLLTWNRRWSALHGDPESLPTGERNLLRAIFGHGPARAALRLAMPDNDTRFARSIIADLRRAANRYPRDDALHTLIRDLRSSSPAFDELWVQAHPAAHTSERKTIIHPLVGDITLDCDVLDVPDADLHIVTYTAAHNTDDRTKLDLVSVASNIPSYEPVEP